MKAYVEKGNGYIYSISSGYYDGSIQIEITEDEFNNCIKYIPYLIVKSNLAIDSKNLELFNEMQDYNIQIEIIKEKLGENFNLEMYLQLKQMGFDTNDNANKLLELQHKVENILDQIHYHRVYKKESGVTN